MFISKAFGGRASDKFIVEKSGFMNYLLPGDEIMQHTVLKYHQTVLKMPQAQYHLKS
jgi:hypothetical protein